MELNREQIIKALECCKWDDVSLCKLCPYYKPSDSNCISEMSVDALELIKALTEKKERLEAYAEKNDSEWREIYADSQAKWEQAYEKLEAEKDRLHTEKSRLIEEYEAEVKITKSDTVRKMQERLKTKMNDLSRTGGIFDTYYLVSKSFIDQIAKEMLEETND